MAAPMTFKLKERDEQAFLGALHFAKEQLGVLHIQLKDKQVDALKAAYFGKDCIAVLPTGYGKSIIYQLLPWLLQKRHRLEVPMITIVVSPLNSIMQDQVGGLTEKGIRACFLNVSGTGGNTYEMASGGNQQTEDGSETESDALEEDTQVSAFTQRSVSLAAIRRGEFTIIYAHPETLVSNRQVGKILRSPIYQKSTGCITIDEVHMVAEWGEDFRKDFKKLADLMAVFPEAVHLAVTATLTPAAIHELTETLQFVDPVIIELNRDRPNIFLKIRTRLPNLQKYDKYDDIISPLLDELREKRSDFPVTIMYVDDLEALGYYYRYNVPRRQTWC